MKQNVGRLKERNKGITLIALIVTIIVLIIIAGISVNLLLGENGIINKTKEARDENEKQIAKETMNFKITTVQIKSYSENKIMPTLQDLADELCEDNDIEYVHLKQQEQASLEKITIGEADSILTKLKEYPFEFEINSSLQLASIDGVQVATVPVNDDDTIVSMTKAELKAMIQNEINNLKETWESIGTISIVNGTGSVDIAKQYKKIKIVMNTNMVTESTDFYYKDANSTYAIANVTGWNHNGMLYLNTYEATQTSDKITITNAGWNDSTSNCQNRSFTGTVYGLPE